MNRSDLIGRYIQKKATAAEVVEIKQLMKADTDFREEVIFQLELQQAVKKEENQKLKQQLQRLDKKETKTHSFPAIWKIAAVFIIGLGLFWFFNTSPDYEKIYYKNFEPYPNIVAPTVRNSNTTENDIKKAFTYYDNHDYSKAAATFKALYNQDKVNYANFYYGISLMADHQVEKAIIALENPTWKIPERYQNQTDWYLALGYLKSHNKEKATFYLEKLKKSDGMMAAAATKILAKIK